MPRAGRIWRNLRYPIIVVCVIVSLTPAILSAPILGYLNICFALIVWVLFLGVASRFPATVWLTFGAVCAAALSVPPLPTYLWVTSDGNVVFRFVGIANLRDSASGIIAWAAVQYVLFSGAAIARRVGRPNAN